jgi:hypothetical protein
MCSSSTMSPDIIGVFSVCLCSFLFVVRAVMPNSAIHHARRPGRPTPIVKVPGWIPGTGGAAGIRTPDLRRARAALSQTKLRPQTGTPPDAPHPLPGWARLDSNQGPRPYQGRALTT